MRADTVVSALRGPKGLYLGLDVGSTTVKAVVVDGATGTILWSHYQRHHTKQPELVLDFLRRIEAEVPGFAGAPVRLLLTGSGAGPLEKPLGGKFVQEVNAVTLAVERLYPDVGSVVELGGQDAKIIVFKEDGRGGRTAIASMNDKCASGTGATLDKCFVKVGLSPSRIAELTFDATKLHHVAAKCGVFAETDVVNLIKAGIPSEEVVASLADAIVMQNLSVLTRGNTLRHKVLLLGGPNAYMPILRECFRLRIVETWKERGHEYPTDVPIDELIFVPDGAEYFAALGCVLFGQAEPSDTAAYLGTLGLSEYVKNGRKSRLGTNALPPLVASKEELASFRELYSVPRFETARVPEGAHVRGVIGLDGGSTSSKAVLIDETGNVLAKAYELSQGNPIADMRILLAKLEAAIVDQGASLTIVGFGATGYAADVLSDILRVDVSVVETVAHMTSAVHYFGDIDVICDIGGQDIKVLFLRNREVQSFRLSNQCSAGNGMLLQAMADQFGVPVTSYADVAFLAELAPRFSYGCAVFLDTDRVNFQKEGFSREELLSGLAQVLPKNVWQYVVQIPRMASLGRRYVLQGGTQFNLAAVKAQVDYIKSRVSDAEIFVHPHTGEAGALGAALEALRVVSRRGHSTFIGLPAAIGVQYTTKNDEDTVCHFCTNMCRRSFIDAERPDGTTSRYIAGFSCDKGMVESKEEMLRVVERQKQVAKQYPNLVDYEARAAFRHFRAAAPLPDEGSPLSAVRVVRGLVSTRRVNEVRPFRRSSQAAAAKRKTLRIGIPRVLGMYATAPFFRTYFEALGIPKHQVIFSDETSEELFQDGAKYGSVDPCFPSKVALAHVHNLLFSHHRPEDKRALSLVFVPVLTHVHNFVERAMDNASCPTLAGTPYVIKAAFTKERDFFASRGVEYVSPALSFEEPTLLRRRMFEAFGSLLEITEDESDFACGEGLLSLHAFEEDLQQKGRAILETVERENRVAILTLARPYHSDPGLNHGILEELQALGYPILSIRSIPKDKPYLARYFSEEQARGQSPLDIGDVWPENYSVNSTQKVWGAKFAARHPHVAVCDLSSFKCGHDAPTYGMVDSILAAAEVPTLAMHDLDANKAKGTIKIRIRTFEHSLRLHRERLEDFAARHESLAYSVAEKRLELLELRRLQLEALHVRDDALQEALLEAQRKARAYRAPVEKRAAAEETKAGIVTLGRRRTDGSIERLAAPASAPLRGALYEDTQT